MSCWPHTEELAGAGHLGGGLWPWGVGKGEVITCDVVSWQAWGSSGQSWSCGIPAWQRLPRLMRVGSGGDGVRALCRRTWDLCPGGSFAAGIWGVHRGASRALDTAVRGGGAWAEPSACVRAGHGRVELRGSGTGPTGAMRRGGEAGLGVLATHLTFGCHGECGPHPWWLQRGGQIEGWALAVGGPMARLCQA